MYSRLFPAVSLAAHTPPHTQVYFEIRAEQTDFWAKLSQGLRTNLQLIQVCVIVFISDLVKNGRIFLRKASKPFASSPAFTHRCFCKINLTGLPSVSIYVIYTPDSAACMSVMPLLVCQPDFDAFLTFSGESSPTPRKSLQQTLLTGYFFLSLLSLLFLHLPFFLLSTSCSEPLLKME